MSKILFLSLGSAVFAFLPITLVEATQVELGVFKLADLPEANCPEKLTVTEEPAPYSEGGYTINGQAKLNSFAGPFAIAASDRFSVTWVANLKPAFQKCVASGRIIKYDGEVYNSHSYLRVRFQNGKIYLILDMTGNQDANNYTTSIVKKGVRVGNPVWSWSGTD